MNEERVWYLLSVQLSGEATPEELEELNTLLTQQPDLGLRADVIRNMWNSRQKPLPVAPNHFDKHLQRLSNHLAQPALQFESEGMEIEAPELEEPLHGNRLGWLWAATAAAACLLIFFLLVWPEEKKAGKPMASNRMIIMTIMVTTNGSYTEDSFGGSPPPLARAAVPVSKRTAPVSSTLYILLNIQ